MFRVLSITEPGEVRKYLFIFASGHFFKVNFSFFLISTRVSTILACTFLFLIFILAS